MKGYFDWHLCTVPKKSTNTILSSSGKFPKYMRLEDHIFALLIGKRCSWNSSYNGIQYSIVTENQTLEPAAGFNTGSSGLAMSTRVSHLSPFPHSQMVQSTCFRGIILRIQWYGQRTDPQHCLDMLSMQTDLTLLHLALLDFTDVACFLSRSVLLQIKSKTLYQQKDFNLLIVVVWNPACNISEVCLCKLLPIMSFMVLKALRLF